MIVIMKDVPVYQFFSLYLEHSFRSHGFKTIHVLLETTVQSTRAEIFVFIHEILKKAIAFIANGWGFDHFTANGKPKNEAE